MKFSENEMGGEDSSQIWNEGLLSRSRTGLDATCYHVHYTLTFLNSFLRFIINPTLHIFQLVQQVKCKQNNNNKKEQAP